MAYHFYNTICRLRQSEEIFLYDKLIRFTPEDEKLVTDFLEIEYETECLNFPYEAPPFDAGAALWAAKTTYSFCQLILYREHREAALPELLPPYPLEITAAAMLSADLCLRFIPGALVNTKNLDHEDAVIPLMEAHLQRWHYSAIGYNIADPVLDTVLGNSCLKQLYIDRIIEKKDKKKAAIAILQPIIKAAMGNYAALFWNDLNFEKTT